MQESQWNIIKLSLKKRVPRYLIDMIGKYRYKLRRSKFEGKEIKETFEEIYRTNHWKNYESVSGPGSTLVYTDPLIPEIQKLIKLYEIRTMIDAPCGDFNWMKKVDLDKVIYLGLDIVPEIIETNQRKYATGAINFAIADITRDTIPKTDLIFIRDCLVHFSYKDIFKTLENVKQSGADYLLTTTFTSPHLNFNISTGDWRPINLQRSPFYFKPPIYKIEDNFKDPSAGNELGKILGLWKIKDINN